MIACFLRDRITTLYSELRLISHIESDGIFARWVCLQHLFGCLHIDARTKPKNSLPDHRHLCALLEDPRWIGIDLGSHGTSVK